MLRIGLLLSVVLLLAACGDTIVDPGRISAQEYIDDVIATSDNLSARAVKASGLYNDLSEEDYPFTLVLVDTDEMTPYLEAQGLSEEVFLSHPELRAFLEHHLIGQTVSQDAANGVPSSPETYQTVSGTDIVFRGQGNEVYANDVPFQGCWFDEKGAWEEKALVCFAESPVSENFDWSVRGE